MGGVDAKLYWKRKQWRINIVKFWMRVFPSRSNFLRFHADFGEIWPSNRLPPRPPIHRGVAGRGGGGCTEHPFVLQDEQVLTVGVG